VELQRRRPVWLATALSFLTGGLYFVWWFGATWSELKRELRDETMHPVWHALTSLVPVYASFRTHAHFRRIDVVAGMTARSIESNAGLAAALNAASWISGTASILPGPTGAVLFVVTATLYGAVTYLGQKALDDVWTSLPGREIVERVHIVEWLALVLSVPLFLAIVGLPFVTP
jgi:hypothetical protein